MFDDEFNDIVASVIAREAVEVGIGFNDAEWDAQFSLGSSKWLALQSLLATLCDQWGGDNQGEWGKESKWALGGSLRLTELNKSKVK